MEARIGRRAGQDVRRRGRTWAVSLLGLYPLALGFLTFVAPHIAHWPLAVRAAIFPFVLLTLMTYVVMPGLTRLTGHWLEGGPLRPLPRSPLPRGALRKGGTTAIQRPTKAQQAAERAVV